jgi:putative heme-binding domain-containing protein
LLGALAAHADDDKDRNLPLMNWYAAEGAVAADPSRGVELLKISKQGKLQRYIPRRIVALALEDEGKAAPAMGALAGLLGEADSPLRQKILGGMLEAAKGRKSLPEPGTWAAVYEKIRADSSEQVREQARALSLLFGSSAARDELRAVLNSSKAMPEARREAMQALLAQRDVATLDVLLKLAAEAGALRTDALRGLANYDDPRISTTLIAAYPKLQPKEKSTALTTLIARLSGMEALIAAIDAKKIPAKDLTAPLARLIQAAKREDFDRWLAKNFGSLKPASEERQKDIARYQQFLGDDAILHASAKNGRALFEKTCAACHSIFGSGGKIGPELPGSFTDTDYLLQNIFDPDAVIGKDYQQTFITTKDGKIVAGVVAAEDEGAVTVKTLAETVTVPKDSIQKRELSPQSMMPAGLLGGLEEPEVRDLFLYLRGSRNP